MSLPNLSVSNEAALLKTLAHPARLQIMAVLRQGEACVCHLEAVLGQRQAYISQQLSVLRKAGMVWERRDGWNVFYSPARPELYELLDTATRLLGQEPAPTPASPVPGCPCPHCNAHPDTTAC